jgi:hypothetical protein
MMSVQAVEDVLNRAREDEEFRRRLRSDPDAALHGFDVSYAERAALISGDADRLRQLGVSSELSDLAPDFHPRRQEGL